MKDWNYNGDMGLEYGGFYWKENGWDDYVLAVEVVPCSDAGGPDNLFYIDSGSIFICEDKLDSALDTIGMTRAEASRADIVFAMKAYHGIESDWSRVIRLGKDESDYMRGGGGWNPTPDIILRRNTNLRKYVEREMLNHD